MRKGISAVVATILLLVITISLAGLAYMYITNIFTASTSTLQVIDGYCVGGTITWTIRNTGTVNISSSSVSIVSVNENCASDPTVPDFPVGQDVDITASSCSSGTHVYRLRGPAGGQNLVAYCA